MMLVDLRYTPLCGEHGNEGASLERVPDLLTEKRVLAKFSRDDHSCSRQQLVGRLRTRRIRADELLGVGQRIQLLLLDEVSVMPSDEVLYNFV